MNKKPELLEILLNPRNWKYCNPLQLFANLKEIVDIMPKFKFEKEPQVLYIYPALFSDERFALGLYKALYTNHISDLKNIWIKEYNLEDAEKLIEKGRMEFLAPVLSKKSFVAYVASGQDLYMNVFVIQEMPDDEEPDDEEPDDEDPDDEDPDDEDPDDEDLDDETE